MTLNLLEVGMQDYADEDVLRREQQKKRRAEYAQSLNSLTFVTYSKKQRGSIREGPRITIVFARTKFHYIPVVITTALTLKKEGRLDIITAQDPFGSALAAVLAKLVCRVPLAIQIHSDMLKQPLYSKWSGLKHWINNIIAKSSLRNADSIIVVATRIKEKLVTMGIPEGKIFVVPSPIQVPRLTGSQGDAVRTQYLSSQADRLLLFVGRMTPERNLDFLLRAFARVAAAYPGVKLLLVGSGPEEAALKILCRALKVQDRVVFVGAVDNTKVYDYYAACDIFVLVSFFEGRAKVLSEAALSGKPIVVTDISGAEDCVIPDKTGFIIPLGNEDMLVEKLLYLLKNPVTAREFGAAGQRFIKTQAEKLSGFSRFIAIWEKTAARSVQEACP